LYYSDNPFLNEFFKIDVPLSNFEKFAKDIEEFLCEKFLEAALEHENEEENEDNIFSDKDEKNDVPWSIFLEDRFLYASEFPNILRTSLFISCYSFLENQLVMLCKEIHKKRKLALSLSDLSGNGIEKAHKYLKKVAQLEFPDQSKDWNFLRKCNLIRNCLVHNGGTIPDNDTKLLSAVNSINSINVKYIPFEKKIELEKEFCFDLIESIRNFFKLLQNDYIEILNTQFRN
jgi:hypothetical protein